MKSEIHHMKSFTSIDVCCLSAKSCPTLCPTVTCQTPLSMGFPRQEYWSGLPFPSPRDLPKLGTEPRGPAQQADSLPMEPPGKYKPPQISLQTSKTEDN